MIRVEIGGYDITDYVENVNWSGSIDLCARSADITLARGAQPEVGDRVCIAVRGAVIFEGIVVSVTKDHGGNTAECLDFGFYLANNQTYKEYSATPAAIANQVCAEFSVPTGNIANISGKTKVTSTGDMTAIQVLERAYNPLKREFYIYFDNGLHVEKLGSSVVAQLACEIADANSTQHIKNMINKVVVVQKGKKKSEVSSGDQQKYGSFQATYTPEKGKNPTVEAKKLLKGLEKTGGLSGIGNIACRAGKAVEVADEKSGLSGIFTIKSDSHTFSKKSHEMKLEFYFDE